MAMTSATATRLVLLLSWHACSHLSSAFHHAYPLSSSAPQAKLLSLSRLQKHSSSAAAAFDITENSPRDIASLHPWAANYGVQTSDCLALTSSDDGMDVFATTNRDLLADTPIVCVPADLILTGNKARQEIGADAAQAEHALLLSDGGAFYLFLKVLKEYELGDESPWYCYLNSLPRHYMNGASMTEFCFGCLPPYAATQARDEKKRLKRFELALKKTAFLSDESKGNSELTKWAFNVVHTRYQEMPSGDVALIPMADMFNHGGEETYACVTYDDDGNCYVYSTRDVPAGEPLTVCYGDPTNPSKLLARYGFLDESSSATFCKWIADEPSSELSQLGYPSRMVFYRDGSISNEVWDCFLYEELGKSRLGEQQAFYQAHVMGDDALKERYKEQYFPQSLSAIQNHVTDIVNELDDLSESVSWQKDYQKHPRLPLLERHNEFVRDIFDFVQQNLDSLSSSPLLLSGTSRASDGF